MGTKRPDAFEDYFLFNVSAKFRVRSLRIFGNHYRCANLQPAGQTEPEWSFLGFYVQWNLRSFGVGFT